ncbi:hypothetical protein PHYSODRAFT_308815 [Phytophthora sojae]|uniref:Rhodanese domain-containing protein n=1 Tax=Phytophthora sojae (strain P6497) TaxID=1094619 RepID=G4YH00_PHYSP|nr:hypothetical protein PHYSODRAFT_308815 [Phytophthora sojae]EGZ27701.1 hypothetical protein PHYSODRAFT_308815 [Phytophthora sojae]|eukprot:XP_009514976.1 hypothetical protein PHYSODRAFT_308815 [Phytophthora sojae]
MLLRPEPRQYVSLYNYVALEESELPKLWRRLLGGWKALGVSGRVYLSPEGINGQLVLPQSSLEALAASFPQVFTGDNMFYGQLLPPMDGESDAPFSKLTVRIRKQLVHDGFERGALNLKDSGDSLPPDQWHDKLKTRNETQDSDTLVLDVRNFYEHEIGRFDGATRIMVDTFRDTFDALDEILEKHEQQHDGQKPKQVMMYCTGGIRCEKVGAYLTQYKGISNVHKLHGGIVNYMRFLKEQRQAAAEARARSAAADDVAEEDEKEISLFKGKNFVFDQRCVGELTESEEVTDDVLGKCFQCGEPCNHHTNCSNLMCGGLILQCQACAASLLGACSEPCKLEVMKMNSMTTQQQKEYRKQRAMQWMPPIPNALSKYVTKRSRSAVARNLHTQRHFSSSRTLCKSIDDSALQNDYVYRQSTALTDDALLRDLREETARTWPKAEQLIDEMHGKFLSFLVQTTPARRVLEIGCFTGYSALCLANGLAPDGSLVTCDIDADTMQFAQRFFDRSSRAAQISAVNQDGLEYLTTLASSAQQQPFDFIFVDANKRKYKAYYDFILEHKLLHPAGLLVFDNTLFRGRVAAYDSGLASNKERIARGLAEFNSYVAQDPRSTQMVMPLWDGLTLVKQTPNWDEA